MGPLHLYLAAVYTNHCMPGGRTYDLMTPSEATLIETVKQHHILESYHYVHKSSFVDTMRHNGAQVFLDSGAFSAHTLGVTIDLPTYCRYIQENRDIIRTDDGDVMASVLDGIGDVHQTYENQLAMEQHGVRPLPCFHFGEDERYLEYYIANYKYITLGGLVPVSTKQAELWLDRIWNEYLVDKSGNPRLKVHGFGMTSIPLMEKYPWYSCDSSSWVQVSRFGNIVSERFGVLCISDESPSAKTEGKHFKTLTAQEQYILACDLYNEGFWPERLGAHYESRFLYNLLAYMKINDTVNHNKLNKQFSAPVGLF